MFHWRMRVYWEDTDAGGVVYHANYLRFLERARSEWLRSCGVVQSRLREREGLALVISAVDIKFLQPARLDDEIEATLRLDHLRAASMIMSQQLTRVADGALLARARVRAGCVDAASLRPAPLPNHLREGLSPQ